MRLFSVFCAAAGLAVTALAATSPAEASFHLIRWEGNGFCQIWDDNIPTAPYPSNFTAASASVPTFIEALAVKKGLLRAGTCTF